jgi:hypothetical protein
MPHTPCRSLAAHYTTVRFGESSRHTTDDLN